MKQTPNLRNILIAAITFSTLLLTACASKEKAEADKADPVTANIKMYTHVWDEIMNKGKIEMFNDSNFTNDVRFHMKPADVVGIDSANAYYSQFLTGFSNIVFTMKDV
ncbi:MAG: nuclear transport factor 2 family protein, partial [Chitinophagaceae bacterium]